MLFNKRKTVLGEYLFYLFGEILFQHSNSTFESVVLKAVLIMLSVLEKSRGPLPEQLIYKFYIAVINAGKLLSPFKLFEICTRLLLLNLPNNAIFLKTTYNYFIQIYKQFENSIGNNQAPTITKQYEKRLKFNYDIIRFLQVLIATRSRLLDEEEITTVLRLSFISYNYNILESSQFIKQFVWSYYVYLEQKGPENENYIFNLLDLCEKYYKYFLKKQNYLKSMHYLKLSCQIILT